MRAFQRRGSGWLLLLIALGTISLPARAQTERSAALSYGRAVIGEISNAAPSEVWTLTTSARDRIAVSVTRAGGTLVPTVQIIDASGALLASAAHDDSAQAASLAAFTLPGPGSYQIVVGRERGAAGRTAGTYQLSVTLRGAGEDTPGLFDDYAGFDMPAIGAEVVSGGGSISNQRWVSVWAIRVMSSDRMRVTVQRSSDDLIPALTLIGPDGREMQRSEADASGAAAQIELTFPAPGDYRVRVQRRDGADGLTTGSFTIRVATLGLGADHISFQAVAGLLDWNTPRDGQLTNRRWKDLWLLDIDAPATVTIAARRTDGSLIPEVALLAADRTELTRAPADDSYATATLSGYRIAQAGHYYVLVTRRGEIDGATVGRYTLTLTRDR